MSIAPKCDALSCSMTGNGNSKADQHIVGFDQRSAYVSLCLDDPQVQYFAFATEDSGQKTYHSQCNGSKVRTLSRSADRNKSCSLLLPSFKSSLKSPMACWFARMFVAAIWAKARSTRLSEAMYWVSPTLAGLHNDQYKEN